MGELVKSRIEACPISPWLIAPLLPPKSLYHSRDLLCYKFWTVLLDEITTAFGDHNTLAFARIRDLRQALIVLGPIPATQLGCIMSSSLQSLTHL